jgi:hypothetical protein
MPTLSGVTTSQTKGCDGYSLGVTGSGIEVLPPPPPHEIKNNIGKRTHL